MAIFFFEETPTNVLIENQIKIVCFSARAGVLSEEKIKYLYFLPETKHFYQKIRQFWRSPSV